jgi:hypothetical protein
MKYKLTVYDCNIIEYHGEKKYPIIINSEVQVLNKYWYNLKLVRACFHI